MKEFELSIDLSQIKGIKKSNNIPRNVLAFDELFNLCPTENGLEQHQPIYSVNSSGESFSWDGQGQYTNSCVDTRDVVLSIYDFIDPEIEVSGATVFVDGTSAGTTDANGEIEVSNLSLGYHSLYITKTGYYSTSADALLNDFFLVS